MAARKKQNTVNLLPQEEFASSTLGRTLAWALSTFRVIVIITEVVVMGAFLSRFWLDARISDLNDLITQKRAVIEASSDFEDQFRSAQKRLGIFTTLSSQEITASGVLETVISFIPNNVTLTTYSFLQETVSVKGVSASERAIAQFVANLESADEFEKITLTQLSTAEDQTSLLQFTIDIGLGGTR